MWRGRGDDDGMGRSFRDRQLAGLAPERAGSVTRFGRKRTPIELAASDSSGRRGTARARLCDVWTAAGLGWETPTVIVVVEDIFDAARALR